MELKILSIDIYIYIYIYKRNALTKLVIIRLIKELKFS